MVLMHRKDIIEQYGVEPEDLLDQPREGGLSVVPKNEAGPTAAVTTVPDKDKVEQPDKERTTAPMASNLASGAIRSFVSDPLMIAGLGISAMYWAKRNAAGDKDASFAGSLYKDGGLQNVQKHIDDKAKQLREEHPDWNDAAVRQEVEHYTASPEFFDYNTSQMGDLVGQGLRNAYSVNKMTGVNKTPDQETFLDDTVQTLGSILMPTGFLKLGTIAEKAIGKITESAIAKSVAKGVGTTADWTVVPGSHWTPGQIAGNLGAGMAIDEVQRQVVGDPTVLPSGAAFNEFNKNVEQLPPNDSANLPAPNATPTQLSGLEDYSPEVQQGVMDIVRSDPAKADLGLAALVALAGGALVAGRAAFRGRVAPSIRPPNPAGVAEDLLARRFDVTRGFNQPTDPNVIRRGVQGVDRATNLEAPVEQLARDLGGAPVQDQVEIAFGQYLSPHAQQNQVKNFIEDGRLIDGTQVAPIKEHFQLVGGADPADRAIYQNAVVAENILRDVGEKRTRATDEALDAANAYNANPSQGNMARAMETQRNERLWQNYDPTVRRYLPGTDEAQLTAQRWVPGRNASVDAMMNSRMEANRAIAEQLHSSGVITNEAYLERLANPLHTGLFEYDPNLHVSYDPSQPRSIGVAPPTQRVHGVISPETSLLLNAEAATRAASINQGRERLAGILSAADPQRREHRFVTERVPQTDRLSQEVGHVTFQRNGQEIILQTSRPHVADAINARSIDDGTMWHIINDIRNFSQKGMVHLLAATGQAPVTLLYDMWTGYLGQKRGTSYGELSRFLRQYESSRLSNNPHIAALFSRAADVVDAIIPDRLVSMVGVGAEAAMLQTMKGLGSALMRQAIQRDTFLGTIARAIPNGNQVLGALGQRLSQHFAASWLGQYQRFAEHSTHAMLSEQRIVFDRITRDMTKLGQGLDTRSASTVFNGLKPIYHSYMAALNTISSLNKFTQFAQHHIIENARPGGATEQGLRQAAENARRSAGDVTGRPNATLLRKGAKLVPFGNIGLQSFRFLLHAATSRGPWDTGMFLAKLGGLGGLFYGAATQIEAMGLTNWYYEQLNDFERVGKLYLPRLDLIWQRMTTGKMTVDMKNPANNFYAIPVAAEASLFIGTMLYGLEQFGLINRGSNRGNTSAEKDMLFALNQTLNVGNIPGVSAAAGMLSGQKVDLTAGLRGRPMFGQIKGSKAQLGDMPSGIPSVAAEVIKSLLGFNGMVAVNSLDAGIQNYNETKDGVRAVNRAWDEGKNMVFEKSSAPAEGVLWDANKKVYGFTAMSSELSRLNKVATDLDAAYSNNFTAQGALRGDMRKVLTDPQIQEMLFLTHGFFKRGPLGKLQEQVNMLRNEADNALASKGHMTPEQVRAAQDKAFLEMRPWHDQMMDIVQMYNNQISSEYGDRFKQEGITINAAKTPIEAVTDLVKKYSQASR